MLVFNYFLKKYSPTTVLDIRSLELEKRVYWLKAENVLGLQLFLSPYK